MKVHNPQMYLSSATNIQDIQKSWFYRHARLCVIQYTSLYVHIFAKGALSKSVLMNNSKHQKCSKSIAIEVPYVAFIFIT